MSIANLLHTFKYKVSCTWRYQRTLLRQENLRSKILNYYAENPSTDDEILEAVDYLKRFPLATFPSTYTHKYRSEEVKVESDMENGLKYVVIDNKRLYFRRSSSEETIRLTFFALLTEQDPASPHCYLSDKFKVEKEDVMFDIGSAEGILPLLHIEKLKHAVLFEYDSEWIEALNATFAPWKEKVTIVPTYVSDKNNHSNITIDTFVQNSGLYPTFIKIDVEGMEELVLTGMQHTLTLEQLKLALCCYHRKDDLTLFTTFMEKQKLNFEVSKGVMLFLNDWINMQPPYFRKGLLRGQK